MCLLDLPSSGGVNLPTSSSLLLLIIILFYTKQTISSIKALIPDPYPCILSPKKFRFFLQIDLFGEIISKVVFNCMLTSEFLIVGSTTV